MSNIKEIRGKTLSHMKENIGAELETNAED
jgi:hypothetical protein